MYCSGAASNVINAAIQPDLRVINAPTILTATCNQPAIHANRVLASHICAGSVVITNPVSGACIGNVGSGLYCNNELAGVLTFGTSCGAANNPGVYVDIRQYRGNCRDNLMNLASIKEIVEFSISRLDQQPTCSHR
jgi:secreted trypsin-like serine protease